MEFITTGNRIAVENFDIGKIYTITWETGNYKSLACTGKGTDFVMFQDQEPDLLFCLTMDSAITVSSIDEGGGSGTNNYNELENKPSINGFVLVGNKTGADLGLASQSDLEDYATNASVVAGLATKQDALSSSQLAAVNSGITSALVTQIGTNTSAIAGKQDALSSSQLAAVNSGITSADVTQIKTNKNNILSKCVYCTCSTASSTADKVVNAPEGWVLQNGCIIGVKNTNTNSANSITLNVNSTGAKLIAYGSNTPYTGKATRITGISSHVTYYMYDGTYWCYITTNRIDSEMPQSEATTGTSTEPRLITAKVLSDTIDEKLVHVENNISLKQDKTWVQLKNVTTTTETFELDLRGKSEFKIVLTYNLNMYEASAPADLIAAGYKLIVSQVDSATPSTDIGTFVYNFSAQGTDDFTATIPSTSYNLYIFAR